MPTDNTRIADPSPQAFAGDSLAQTARRLFNATRPKFFPASVLPVLAGTAWGFSATGNFDWLVFALALFATVCVHAASNVLNDVGDESGGTDQKNEDRIYPYTGGSRFIQTGIMSASEMARLGISLLTVAAIAGLALIFLRGQMVLYFGLAGVVLGVLYSLGPVRLASIGIGETAVAVAFGVVPVAGAAWLQGATLDTQLLLYSIPVSAWVAAILLINEVPDIDADGSTGQTHIAGQAGTGRHVARIRRAKSGRCRNCWLAGFHRRPATICSRGSGTATDSRVQIRCGDSQWHCGSCRDDQSDRKYACDSHHWLHLAACLCALPALVAMSSKRYANNNNKGTRYTDQWSAANHDYRRR